MTDPESDIRKQNIGCGTAVLLMFSLPFLAGWCRDAGYYSLENFLWGVLIVGIVLFMLAWMAPYFIF